MDKTLRPIAVIGASCRFPGADNLEAFWDLLSHGRDAVTEIGDDRWAKGLFYHPRQSEVGKSYTFAAGVLSEVDRFDAGFFGVSPREALQMDPQQRLLLELVQEAVDDSGMTLARLAGKDAGVYVGVSGLEYSNLRLGDPANSDQYFMIGNQLSTVANRISYIFDLHGPSFAVDTACSSSLVALHEACEALRHGRVSMAICGGVNILLTPFPFIGFSRAKMLSPRGRCHAFDASGDGYVRAEGGGVVMLKLLEDAVRDGDTIRAVIHATGVNSDGRTTGMSLPSRDAQAALLKQVYGDNGIDPNKLAYFEAHGTGTSAGDPIETGAIAEALSSKRDDVLPIGSVKTNIGHLEPASGMAGLIKSMLVLEHQAIPASLHFNEPNPAIDFDGWKLGVVTDLRPVDIDEDSLIGVNSFGFGGTNAHVVISRGPAVAASEQAQANRLPPLLLSARSPEALQAAAVQYRDRLIDLGDDDGAVRDLVYSAAINRDHFDHRLVANGTSAGAMLAQLDAFVDGLPSGAAVSGKTVGPAPKLAFVFSGNGSQWAGMGRDSFKGDEDFRAKIEEVDALLSPLTGWSVVEKLFSDTLEADLVRTDIAQPLLFAVQLGICAALAARGVVPQATSGHSVGEVAAAHIAGALTLEQAVQVIYHRSRRQQETQGQGRMAALSLPLAEAQAAIEPFKGKLEIAAVNSPRAVTISGDTEALEALGEWAAQNRWVFRLLDIDYAFHSAAMEPTKAGLLGDLKSLKPSATRLPFSSTVTGGLIEGEQLDADYWWKNIRQPVLFSQASDALIGGGHLVFVEIGPTPVLQSYVRDCLREAGQPGTVLITLHRRNQDAAPFDTVLTGAHVAGAPLDIDGLYAGAYQRCALPLYPWQRQRHWFERTIEGTDLLEASEVHPLLGWQKGSEPVYINTLDTDLQPWLDDHRVDTGVVFPAAGYVELALATAKTAFGDGVGIDLRDLEIMRPLTLDEGRARSLEVRWHAEAQKVEIYSRPRLSREGITLHGVAHVGRLAAQAPAAEVPSAKGAKVSGKELYELADQLGLPYGPAFRLVEGVTLTSSTEALATIAPVPASAGGEDSRWLLHPSVLDGAFQALFALLAKGTATGGGRTYLPARIGRLQVFGTGETRYCRLTLTHLSGKSAAADFELLDASGNLLARAVEVRFRRAHLARTTSLNEKFFQYRAVPKATGGLLTQAAKLDLADLRTVLSNAGLIGNDDEPNAVQLLLDAYSAAIAYETLVKLAPEGALLPMGLVNSGVVSAKSLPLLHRLLRIAQDEGLASENAPGWQLADESSLPPSDDLWRMLIGDYPDALPEILLAGRAANHLTAVLADSEQGAPKASAALTAHLAAGGATRRPLIDGVATTFAHILAQWPEGRPLRVLEIGAGDGALTRRLLAAIGSRSVELTVSDANQDAVDRAEAALSGAYAPRCVLLDPAKALLDQSLAGERFDLILGAAVLAERGAGDAPVILRQLLAENGTLLLAEPEPSRFLDLVRGLDAHWWQQTADVSLPVGLALTAAEWTTTLDAAGYGNLQAIAMDGGGVLLTAANPELLPIAKTEDAGQTDGLAVLLTDAQGMETAVALGEALKARGRAAMIVEVGPAFRRVAADRLIVPLSNVAEGQALLDALAAEGTKIAEMVHLAGLMADEADPMAVQELRCLTALPLIQAMDDKGPRLWFVTMGAQGQVVRAAQAPLWGLGRVAVNEYPHLDIRMVDLAPGEADFARLAEEIVHPDGETEILLSEAGRSVLRLHKAKPAIALEADASTKVALKLDIDQNGSLDRLSYRPVVRKAPGKGEIEIEVKAAGLNFRDVMWAMGVLPEEALLAGFAGPTLGMECAGIVSAVGEGVGDFAIGDRVMAFASGCFASHLTTSTVACAPIPGELSFEAAATIPSAFFTAYYALGHLGQLAEGERVLIHGAAGGVGIAAIQYAKSVGAIVFATAGSHEKRDFLKMLGADYILDSRSLAFADDVLALTDGEGVDVVLNSLAGEAMERSLGVVKPFGRFLELGKRDFYQNSRLGLRPFRNNITFYGIDADQLLSVKPAFSRKLFREMVTLFEDGAFKPLPYRAFVHDEAVAAFRLMQQSGHIGKIVLTYHGVAVPSAKPAAKLALSSDGIYLVAGGLGGFGLATARRLVERGARKLVLSGRSGAASDAAKAAVAELQALGAEVIVESVDLTDAAATTAMIGRIKARGTLKGVLHTAMVLDDGLMSGQDAERFRRVMAPKIAGADHLDKTTHDLPLDLFVVYSSATTYIGNPGQSNYVAANLYLEALIRRRRSEGKAGLAVAWGAIDDVGYLARHREVQDSLGKRLGHRALGSSEALDALERLLVEGTAERAVVELDARQARQMLPLFSRPTYAGLGGKAAAREGAEAGPIDIRAAIKGLSRAAARDLVAGLLGEEVAQIMRLPADKLDHHKPIADLGMDSLMAVELRMAVEARFGVELPVLSLSDGTTLSGMADKLVGSLTGDEAPAGDGDLLQLSRYEEGSSNLDMSALSSALEAKSDSVKRLLA
ncbi:SDR family NAD(P)-dependent oxidoreductase [Lacibacterium aquatile]|uniref:SDR family NAD(P)-dependent oxidoreductase n=1 Tax=Lacibacterium aquatile TaxID=1168082 RepID=A0ABW5DVF4_9PROT